MVVIADMNEASGGAATGARMVERSVAWVRTCAKLEQRRPAAGGAGVRRVRGELRP